MQIIATADIHIGRRASKFHEDVCKRNTPAKMWLDIVEFAVRQQVDALVVAGDLVNHGKSYFEAYGVLQKGIKRLEENGIYCIVVAGNHDVEVLSYLARTCKSEFFRILGQNGEWEQFRLATQSGGSLDIWGWSFPKPRVNTSPLSRFPSEKVDQTISAIGVIHGQKGGGEGPYCPIKEEELAASGIGTWVLGHVHAPAKSSEMSDGKGIFYTGSPLPMDPGEPGPHGPWLLTRAENTPGFNFAHVPLSPLRYEQLTVSLDGVNSTEEAIEKITNQARDVTEQLSSDQPELTDLCYRLRLTGRPQISETDIRQQIEEKICSPDASIPFGEMNVIVETGVDYALEPWFDVENLADDKTPMGQAAQLYLELIQPESAPVSEDTRDFLENMQKRIKTEIYQRFGSSLEGEETISDLAQFRQHAATQVRRLLEELYSQRLCEEIQ
jgi:exonuclease SbcD